MFMVTTEAGARVYAGDKGSGMPEPQAKASAKDRNERAAAMGIKARYVIAEYAPVPDGDDD